MRLPSVPPPFSSSVPAPLTSLPVGARLIVKEVRDAESRPFLRALGLTHAAPLRLCKLGDPCIVQVRATRIGICRSVADSILVVPAEEAS